MAQVYLRCSDADHMLPNRYEADPDDLAEACEQAALVVRTLIALPGPEDWRAWVLHVSDDLGEEILELSFKSVMGRLH